jgi:hypothetical protein
MNTLSGKRWTNFVNKLHVYSTNADITLTITAFHNTAKQSTIKVEWNALRKWKISDTQRCTSGTIHTHTHTHTYIYIYIIGNVIQDLALNKTLSIGYNTFSKAHPKDGSIERAETCSCEIWWEVYFNNNCLIGSCVILYILYIYKLQQEWVGKVSLHVQLGVNTLRIRASHR